MSYTSKSIRQDSKDTVRIIEQRIPAEEIQVDGFPRDIDGVRYGIYFEVPFEETGEHWIVSHGDPHSRKIAETGILVEMLKTKKSNIYERVICKNWSDFLTIYNDKIISIRGING